MLQETPDRWQRPLASAIAAKPDQALVNDWHAVAFADDVQDGQTLGTQLLGEELVIWRHAGKVQVWKDLCIHRGAQLSKGWVVNGNIVCPYHGWRYDCDAKCVLIPAHPNTPPVKGARLPSSRRGALWFDLGLLGDPSTTSRRSRMDNKQFRTFHADPIRSAPTRFARSRTSSTPRIFLSCMPASTA